LCGNNGDAAAKSTQISEICPTEVDCLVIAKCFLHTHVAFLWYYVDGSGTLFIQLFDWRFFDMADFDQNGNPVPPQEPAQEAATAAEQAQQQTPPPQYGQTPPPQYGQVPPQYGQQPYYGEKPMHTPTLVVGILAIVLAFATGFVGLILGIVGIVLHKKYKDTYNTKIGYILSLIGLIIGAIITVVMIVLIAIGVTAAIGLAGLGAL
jgi:hypothetical protein